MTFYTDSSSVDTVAGRKGTVVLTESDIANLTADLAALSSPVQGNVLRTKVYAPTTVTPKATAGGTNALLAFDTTNLTTGQFVAPASGTVLVTVSFLWSVGGGWTSFGLCTHGLTPVGNVVGSLRSMAITSGYATQDFLVSGLVSGQTYEFDLIAANQSSSVVTITAQSLTAPTGAAGAPVIFRTVVA